MFVSKIMKIIAQKQLNCLNKKNANKADEIATTKKYFTQL